MFRYVATIDNQEFTLELLDERHVSINGKIVEIDFVSISGQPVYSLIVNGESYEGYVYAEEERWSVLLRGRLYAVGVEDERERRLRTTVQGRIGEAGEFHLKAPMPGLIVAVPVSEGQHVEKGQVLVILESMKMQNELKAPRAGTVQRIRVKAGEAVEQKQTLLSLA